MLIHFSPIPVGLGLLSVSFTEDVGYDESQTSEATSAVAPRPRSHWNAHTYVQTRDERDEKANGYNPSRGERATADTADELETLRRGLRVVARMIARAHLRRQESRSGTAHNPTAEHEHGD